MKELIRKMEKSGFGYFGIRSENRNLAEGDELEPSHDWEDNIMLDELLSGTCATGIGHLWFDGEKEDMDTVQKAIDLNGGKYGDYMYVIGGDRCEYGNDESEIIIENAVVIAKISLPE